MCINGCKYTYACESFKRNCSITFTSQNLGPWFIQHRSGCIGPHSDVIPVYLELPPLLPPRWVPSLTSPCCLCSSSWYVDDLDLSWTREPPNAAPVEVCAVGPCVSHAQNQSTIITVRRYALHGLSYRNVRLFDCLSVCHTRGLCPHGSTYDHDFFIIW